MKYQVFQKNQMKPRGELVTQYMLVTEKEAEAVKKDNGPAARRDFETAIRITVSGPDTINKNLDEFIEIA